MLSRFGLLLVFSLILTGCGAETAPTDVEPTVTPFGFVLEQTPRPFWEVPAIPVMVENAPQLAYLGKIEPNTRGTVYSHDISNDGLRMVTLSDNALTEWDLLNGRSTFSRDRLSEIAVFYSPDKTEVYSLDDAGIVRVYDNERGVEQTRFPLIEDFSGGVFAYDSFTGWMTGANTNGTVKVWDTFNRQALSQFDSTLSNILTLAFSPNGTQLAITGDTNQVKVWDWESKTLVTALDGAFYGDEITSAAAFSPDGTQLAVSVDNRIVLIDIDSDIIEHQMIANQGSAGAFLLYSPDGQFLVSAGRNNSIGIWNPQTGELISYLAGTGTDISSASFSPRSDLLLTSVLFGPINLWNLSDPETVGTVRAELDIESPIVSVDWTEDGRTLAFFGTTGAIYVWGIPETDS